MRAAKEEFLSEPVILMIDDDPDTLMLQEVVLQGEGMKIITANSWNAALEIIAKNDSIDLVLLDYEMGDFKGPQFIDELEQKYPDFFKRVPVVFVSAHRELTHGKAAGHIRKGTDIEKFANTVKTYLPKKQGFT
jgi:CheY-like chemotaxis protein